MPQIIVENLIKKFQVAQRQAGMWGALKGVFHRRYQEVFALTGIHFSVETGELVGYIGANGAGKSTTVKILAGILVPEDGKCVVMGRIPWLQRIEHVQEIGVVFGQRTQLWWDLPVIESFELLRDIYKVQPVEYQQMLDEMIAMLQLEALLDTPVRQLSLGQRMRCDLAASLLHRPKILFLDEPTIGLDAVSKLTMRDFIKRLNREQGVTVLLTTHDMDDIESLCSRVIVIHRGQIFLDGTLPELRARITSERRMIIDLDDEYETIQDPDAALIQQEGHRVYLRYDPTKIATAKLIARITRQHTIRDLIVENPPIEEIVARLYREADA